MWTWVWVAGQMMGVWLEESEKDSTHERLNLRMETIRRAIQRSGKV